MSREARRLDSMTWWQFVCDARSGPSIVAPLDDAAITVALVTPSFPPSVGGVEAHVDQIARGLVQLGCSVQVLTQVGSGDRNAGTEQAAEHLTIHRFRD